MKLIIGLGNPGLEYRNTRHNVGFLFLDYLKDKFSLEDFKDSKFKALISEGQIGQEKVILLKPMTYMNLSGESISLIVNFYKLDYLKDIIVIYDDMSMEFSKLRFRISGSAGGHNGIKSLIKCSGSENFLRIKIGVGYDSRYDASDWVLSKFSTSELEDMHTNVFPEASELLISKI